jgi:predicted transposase/invertase (TIGR01784 family)
MREFLKRNGSEVVNMLFTEFNMEDAIKVFYEEGKEDGIEQNQLKIASKMIKNGYTPEKIAEIVELPLETIQSIQ